MRMYWFGDFWLNQKELPIPCPLYILLLCYGPKDGATIRARICPQAHTTTCLDTHRALFTSGVTTPHVLFSSIHLVGAYWLGPASLLFWFWQLESMTAREKALGLDGCLVLLLHSGRAEFFFSLQNDEDSQILLGNTKSWWRFSTLRGCLPSTLGGPARHIFVILWIFCSGGLQPRFN